MNDKREVFRVFLQQVTDAAFEKVALELKMGDRMLSEQEEVVLRTGIWMGAAEAIIRWHEQQESGK